MLYDYESIVRSFKDGTIGRSIYNQINDVNNSDRDLINLLLFFSTNNADKLFEDILLYIFFERNFNLYEVCSTDEFDQIAKYIITSSENANTRNSYLILSFSDFVEKDGPNGFWSEMFKEHLDKISLRYNIPDLVDHVYLGIKNSVIKFKN